MDQSVTLSADDVARLREYMRRGDALLADETAHPAAASGELWKLSGYLDNVLNVREASGHPA